MTEPANAFDSSVDQAFVEMLMERFIDTINDVAAVHGMRPVENIVACHSLAIVVLATFPKALDASVDAYVASVAQNMRGAIDGHRAIRDLPQPANAN